MPPRIAVVLDILREQGFSDAEVQRVQLGLEASRVEPVTLAIEPDLQAEYARALPREELARLASTDPRQMFEGGWRATAIVQGRVSQPVAGDAVLLLRAEGERDDPGHTPERVFSFVLDDVDDFYVYSFHHIDVHSFERLPWEVLDATSDQVRLLTHQLEALFRAHGWEGDGDVRLLWLPPFVMADPDTWGVPVWHVKQSNNGTSWLAAEAPLNFPALVRVTRPAR